MLAPGKKIGAPIKVPELEWHAQAVPYYDYLLAGGHCIRVRLPQAARFVWHKLYASTQRSGLCTGAAGPARAVIKCGPSPTLPLPPMKAVEKIESFIFWSRWLQAPLYLGLIAAQGVYVFQFMHELAHLISKTGSLSENEVMLIVLGLIDVVMIANLLVMVIVGGYETFVSRLDLDNHPDQPEWLSHVNAGVLKVKLATALIGISSIHLLKTFINAGQLEDRIILWQVVIHVVFLFSAIMIAFTDKLMNQSLAIQHHAKH